MSCWVQSAGSVKQPCLSLAKEGRQTPPQWAAFRSSLVLDIEFHVCAEKTLVYQIPSLINRYTKKSSVIFSPKSLYSANIITSIKNKAKIYFKYKKHHAWKQHYQNSVTHCIKVTDSWASCCEPQHTRNLPNSGRWFAILTGMGVEFMFLQKSYLQYPLTLHNLKSPPHRQSPSMGRGIAICFPAAEATMDLLRLTTNTSTWYHTQHIFQTCAF